jgi:hypothetical protein
MKNILIVLSFLTGVFVITSCSKKSTPSTTSVPAAEIKKAPAAPKKIKAPVPKVIVVNDLAAQKTVDGRYYYDLNGKRYWRNNRDGKYYLFNKSMYNNDDFKGTTGN